MKILVIGGGGREHALVWKIAQSKRVERIYCAPGNPGTGELAENVAIKVYELDKLVQFAKKEKIDLTIVGPEIPLIAGIVNIFQKNKLPIIGPTKKAARLEGSKAFAKKLMLKYRIPTADFKTFQDYTKAKVYLEKSKYPIVVKVSGQASGKGVLVAKGKKEAGEFLQAIMLKKIFGSSGDEVVIEEYLEGPEVSFMVATDGENFVSLLPSQDHKRVLDKDQGPNTGGMGAYTPLPFITTKLLKTIEEKIVKKTIHAMEKEDSLYQGILYPGLILTHNGPKVLEFNCRFGDPETQPLMTLLETDIVDVFQAIRQKKIKNLKLKWKKGSSICVVLTAKGYPGNYEKGENIEGLDRLKNKKYVQVFHSGTKKAGDKIVTEGGRVLGITAQGKNLQSAIKNVYRHIRKSGIYFSGMHYRKDIGKKGLMFK